MTSPLLADLDFTAFKAAFRGDLVIPTSPDYDSAISRWAFNAQRRAKIVAFVKDEGDVALAITYARCNSLPIAIRGGAHSASGTSSSEGGLVIDLSRHIKTVKVDAERKRAYVGGGALWGDVDKETIKFGLATVGGTVNDTGVGGLILGGGYGWLTGEHGLAIDNLIQATVVVADGRILTVSDTENTDLFWAIRGGGSNFGVVSEFVLKLHPQRPTVYAGVLVFPRQSSEMLISVTAEWWPKASEKEGMFQIATVVDGQPMIIVNLFYNGSEAEGRANFKKFFDIGPISDKTSEMPYEQLNGLLNQFGVAMHGRGRYLKGTTTPGPNRDTFHKAHLHAAEIGKHPDKFEVNISWEYVPLAKVLTVPPEATAFRRQADPNVLIIISWDKHDENSVEKARKYSREILEIIVRDGRDQNSQLGYSNYATDAGSKDATSSIFAENYPRLQEVKKLYDPSKVFNKWFPITPAIL